LDKTLDRVIEKLILRIFFAKDTEGLSHYSVAGFFSGNYFCIMSEILAKNLVFVKSNPIITLNGK
jgi:hypothetical protein